MKLSAKYCIVDVRQSQKAGIASHNEFISNFFPLDLASNMRMRKPSGSRRFIRKYRPRQRNSPKNMVVD
jgi:hypothetical protein